MGIVLNENIIVLFSCCLIHMSDIGRPLVVSNHMQPHTRIPLQIMVEGHPGTRAHADI